MGLLQQYGASDGQVNSGGGGRTLSGGPKILRHLSTTTKPTAGGGLMAVLTFEVEGSLTQDEIGSRVTENLNVKNSNPETVRISRNQSATIVAAALGNKDADDDLMVGKLLYAENAPREAPSKKAGDVDATGKPRVYKNNGWTWATTNEDRIRIARLLNAQPPEMFNENVATLGYAPQPQQSFAPTGYAPQQPQQGYAPQQGGGYVPQQQQPTNGYSTQAPYPAPQQAYNQAPPQQMAQPQGYVQPMQQPMQQQPVMQVQPAQGVGAWSA